MHDLYSHRWKILQRPNIATALVRGLPGYISFRLTCYSAHARMDRGELSGYLQSNRYL